jgi:hypothetical protein
MLQYDGHMTVPPQTGTGRTRLESIKLHLLSIMHHLLSPEKG